MGHRTTSRRAAALRRAREAKAVRDAERIRREQLIEQALADFYEATGAAGQIREDARRRADKILDEAEVKAQQSDAVAGRAVRTLRELGQTNADIAELCDIGVGTVRTLANDHNEAAVVSGPSAGADEKDAASADHHDERRGDARVGERDETATAYAEGSWRVGLVDEAVHGGFGQHATAG